MINFDKAFRFPVSQDNWKETVGVFFLITFVLSIISAILQVTFQFPVEVLTSIAKEQGSQALQNFASSVNASASMSQGFVNLLTFPITLYLSGYVFDVVRHLLYDKKEAITPHGDFIQRFKFGAVKTLIAIVVGVIVLLTVLIPVSVVVSASLLSQNFPILSAIFFILSGIIFLVWLFFAIFYGRFAEYSMEYLYLSKGFKYMFNLKVIHRLIKENWWKSYSILIGLDFLGGVLIALSILSCCLVFLVQPIITTYVTFVLAYCYGSVYKAIYNTQKV